MDLWIKDQARKGLYKVDNIKVGTVIYPSFWVFTRLENNSICLGEYETEERALQVLNEIQKLLTPQICALANKIANNEYNDYNKLTNVYAIMDSTGDVNVSEISTIIYEMPKE